MRKTLAAAVVVVAALAASAQAGPYPIGFVWDREADWIAQDHNPDRDSTGVGVYYYYGFNPIPDLSGSNSTHTLTNDGDEWYRLTRQGMAGRGSGKSGGNGWRYPDTDNDARAFINDGNMWHGVRGNRFYGPEVVWTNPTGEEAFIEVSGTWELIWPSGFSADIDLALVYHDVSADTWTEIGPTGRYDHATYDGVEQAVSPVVQKVDVGDEIIWSFHPISHGGDVGQARLIDGFVLTRVAEPTVIPEPVSAIAVVLGVGAVGRYLRRRRS